MHRVTRLPDGTVIQGAMALDSASLSMEGAMPSHVLGVVLTVQVADATRNRTSFQRSDLRGYMHEASVLVMLDGQEPYLRLDNVVICPDHVTGLDNYSEQLPRPSTQTVAGDPFNGTLNGINPYDLTGDWCIVSFIGGSIRHAFISRWWPHTRDTYDPQTSGNGNPNQAGQGQTLDQTGRYFRRLNGLETIITREGDLYFSTRFANSPIQYGQTTATEGRFARQESADHGGTVSINIKPSQSLLIDFNPEVEGKHHLSGFEDALPQTNPRTSRMVADRNTNDTRIVLSKEDIRLSTSQTVDVKSGEDVIITADNSIQLKATHLSSMDFDGGLDLVGKADTFLTTEGADITVSSDQNTKVLGTESVQIVGGGGTLAGAEPSIEVTPTGVVLGTGLLGGVVGGTDLMVALNAFANALADPALTAAMSGSSQATALLSALQAASVALVTGVQAAVSNTTTVG